jgi:hypothetical protein
MLETIGTLPAHRRELRLFFHIAGVAPNRAKFDGIRPALLKTLHRGARPAPTASARTENPEAGATRPGQPIEPILAASPFTARIWRCTSIHRESHPESRIPELTVW